MHYSISLPSDSCVYSLNRQHITGEINAYKFLAMFKADENLARLHEHLDEETYDEYRESTSKTQSSIVNIINDRFDIDYPREYVYCFDPLEFSEQIDGTTHLYIRFCIYSSLADVKILAELESAFRDLGHDALICFQVEE